MHVRNILTRLLLRPDQFEAAVASYEQLFGQPARLRFDYPEMGLRLAQVAQLLIIGGDTAALKPFADTAMTFLVDDIHAYAAHLPALGASVVRAVRAVPSGHNMLVRQADGTLVEYVQHARPDPADDVLLAVG